MHLRGGLDPEEEIKKVLQGNKYATSMPLIWSARLHTVFSNPCDMNAVQESRHFLSFVPCQNRIVLELDF